MMQVALLPCDVPALLTRWIGGLLRLHLLLEQLARPDGLLMKALAHSRGPIRADDDAA